MKKIIFAFLLLAAVMSGCAYAERASCQRMLSEKGLIEGYSRLLLKEDYLVRGNPSDMDGYLLDQPVITSITSDVGDIYVISVFSDPKFPDQSYTVGFIYKFPECFLASLWRGYAGNPRSEIDEFLSYEGKPVDFGELE